METTIHAISGFGWGDLVGGLMMWITVVPVAYRDYKYTFQASLSKYRTRAEAPCSLLGSGPSTNPD